MLTPARRFLRGDASSSSSRESGRLARRRTWIAWTLGVMACLAFFFWWTSARILSEPLENVSEVGQREFRTSIGSLLGAEYCDGNEVEFLVNGRRFFPVMLQAIREARSTVTLETYIWASGLVSDQFIEALSERARHGVKVHVLADGMGTLNLTREDRRRMLDAGVQFIVYGREHWYEIKPNINHHTHRKLLIIDGQTGFAGGMCIDDRWEGEADSPEVWRETQVRVSGPAVRQMQSVFATNWLQTTGRLLAGPEYFPETDRRGGVSLQCYKSGPHEDPENARISYLLAIAGARRLIQIGHAYFVPDDLAIEMLLRARARGVRVQVIVPAINASRIGRAVSRSRWGELLAAGVEFYLYQPAMYHCKTMTVDETFTTIGSVNFDNRSFGINDEVNVNLLDEGAASRAREIFEDDLKKSRPLTRVEFEGRPWWQKLIDHTCGLFRSQM